MKTIRIDERTIATMAEIAFDLYEIPIDVDDPRSVQAGMKDFFDRMQTDTIPDSEPIAQLAQIKADLIRVHDRLARETYPQPRRIAA